MNRVSFGGSVKSGASTKGSDQKSSYHDSPEDLIDKTPNQNGEEMFQAAASHIYDSDHYVNGQGKINYQEIMFMRMREQFKALPPIDQEDSLFFAQGQSKQAVPLYSQEIYEQMLE